MRCNHSGIVRGDWPAQAREWVQAVVPTFRAQRGGVSKRARKYSSLEKSVVARSRCVKITSVRFRHLPDEVHKVTKTHSGKVALRS